jgi:dethiobiotin synthetase
MKPVAAGADRRRGAAQRGRLGLLAASSERRCAARTASTRTVSSRRSRLTSPRHRRASKSEIERILRAYRALAARADVVIVAEGAGGFRVPLNAREDAALAARWDCPLCWWSACGWAASIMRC